MVAHSEHSARKQIHNTEKGEATPLSFNCLDEVEINFYLCIVDFNRYSPRESELPY